MKSSPFDPLAVIRAKRQPSAASLTVENLYQAIVAKGGAPILILPAIGGGVLYTKDDAQPNVTATQLECLARQLRRQARRDRKQQRKDDR